MNASEGEPDKIVELLVRRNDEGESRRDHTEPEERPILQQHFITSVRCLA